MRKPWTMQNKTKQWRRGVHPDPHTADGKKNPFNGGGRKAAAVNRQPGSKYAAMSTLLCAMFARADLPQPHEFFAKLNEARKTGQEKTFFQRLFGVGA